ncbi:TPA: hypothetical protein OMI58_005033 [Escherichia coli]|nr:hypothetical protein [Escherichia coli]MBS9054987.1 hypothetical protein [Escherichia coli]HAM4808997.1 hypothetical protein [Escherichia coli]HCQ9020838.1 hypothetical protein [Escherichia coli]HDD9008303.1 hypothetical protein [Escherichia coli]
MKLKLILMVVMAMSPALSRGQYVSYLWAPTASSISGYINYTGWGSGSVNTQLYGWSVNQANAVYSTCDSGSMGTDAKNQAYDWFVFIPKKIDLGNVSASVIPLSINGWTYASMNNELWVMKKMTEESSYNYDGKTCPISVFSYRFSNLTPGSVPISIDFFDVPVGSYNTVMKVKIQFSELFWSIGSMYQKISNQTALDYAQEQNIPVDINVNNKCTVGHKVVNIDHGKLAVDVAENNIVKKDISIHCTGETSITLRLHSNQQSKIYYDNGLGVDVGNGWDSLLSIKSNDRAQYGKNITDVIQSNETKNYSLQSVLKKKDNYSPGVISGSAILEASLP